MATAVQTLVDQLQYAPFDLTEQDREPAYELAFENEATGQTQRFACNEDGEPLVACKRFVYAVDHYRFVGMFNRHA